MTTYNFKIKDITKYQRYEWALGISLSLVVVGMTKTLCNASHNR